jgi:hypothetical protein
MGASRRALSLSWGLTATVEFAIIAIGISLLLSTTVLKDTATLVIFVFFGLFMLTLVSFAFLLSVFFNKAKLAAIVGPIAVGAASALVL